MKGRVIVVTGANKGIGYEVARGLLKNGHRVIVTGRDQKRIDAAVAKLKESEDDFSGIDSFKLDITSSEDATKLSSYLAEKYNGAIDTLINNAGMAFKGDTWGHDEALQTINCNVHGTINVTNALLPLLKKSEVGARIVNTCSMAGHLRKLSKELQEQFTDPNLTVEKLTALLTQFTDAIKSGDYKSKGWPKSMYGVSKIGEIAYGKILAREQKEIRVYSYCPGWCRTDMAGSRAPRTAEQGAETGIWLGTDPSVDIKYSGEFFSDKKLLKW